MVGKLLMRGMLAGIAAGLLTFAFAKVVGEPQDVELFACDRAGDADSEARTGKRMPADKRVRQIELAAERADLVLE